MYQITCDQYILYDPRDADLVLLNPRCKLEVNTVGEASFTILPNHPWYNKLQKLKSVFEFKQNEYTLFRGRMTNDSRDLSNCLYVDLEGVLAYANDTIIPPFTLSDGRITYDNHTETFSDDVVRSFLVWILDQHNAQVADWQKLKVGNVTVADPNNNITRSSNEYLSTWDVLKSKLFDSSLGGYLCIRYESDGNYVDYLNEFTLTNTQKITLGENLLDIVNDSDATETYSAILPLGAAPESDDVNTVKQRLTVQGIADGDLTNDIVKKGKFIYSKSAVEQYGWICVPVNESTWDDVTNVTNLKNKAVEYLTGTAMLLSGTTTINAVDLSFTDEQIQSFKIYRNIIVDSPAHGISDKTYPLLTLDIDIFNPQNTKITIGESIRSLTDINATQKEEFDEKITDAKNELQENIGHVNDKVDDSVDDIRQTVREQRTAVMNDCEKIIMSALESYVETGNYEEFKETVESQLLIMADNISMNFTTTTEQIQNVNGDLQAEVNQRKKYITFSDNGIIIGAGENAMTLELDNDMISFKKNGVQFGWWDGVDFHTGNIIVDVNERAQFGNFAFVPRSDGSLMFLKVGG